MSGSPSLSDAFAALYGMNTSGLVDAIMTPISQMLAGMDFSSVETVVLDSLVAFPMREDTIVPVSAARRNELMALASHEGRYWPKVLRWSAPRSHMGHFDLIDAGPEGLPKEFIFRVDYRFSIPCQHSMRMGHEKLTGAGASYRVVDLSEEPVFVVPGEVMEAACQRFFEKRIQPELTKRAEAVKKAKALEEEQVRRYAATMAGDREKIRDIHRAQRDRVPVVTYQPVQLNGRRDTAKSITRVLEREERRPWEHGHARHKHWKKRR